MNHPVFIAFIISLMALFSCNSSHNKNHDANAHMHQTDFKTLVQRFDNPERAKWQQPEKVVALFGDISGKTVADIGAGTGYFSFRLHHSGAKVIAIDIDERFTDFIDSLAMKKEVTGIETRVVPEDNPQLNKEEVDNAIIVNTYHHINNRVAYFKKVLYGLKPGGTLMVVDFVKKETPFGPPVKIKLSHSVVEAELRKAGYHSLTVDTTMLAYQYIVTGTK